MTKVEPQDSLAARIDSRKYSSYLKLIRVTARVLVMFQNCPRLSFRNVAKVLTTANVAKAEAFWILEAQKSLRQDLKSGKFRRLCPEVKRRWRRGRRGTRGKMGRDELQLARSTIATPEAQYFFSICQVWS